MNSQTIIINFGELSLKGKNKSTFINQLNRNIKNSLKDYAANFESVVTHDHIYLHLRAASETQIEQMLTRLADVSGIHSFSLAARIPSDLSLILAQSLEMAQASSGLTFKVISKRIDKTFYPISDQLNREVAKNILQKTKLRVDVHQPDLAINIKIYPDDTYLYHRVYKGAGGLPLGMGTRALMLISGGIDSPVASYLLMRRGINLDFIHFAAPPYTSSGVIDKIKDLLTVLNRYQPSIRLLVVPFTKIQEKIYENTPEGYAITLMRRMMYRLSTQAAQKFHCLALATGESVGQVASQTLQSLAVINDVTKLPILRPLVASDKEDIMGLARRIGTYEISIRPYTDCCTIFAPVNPKTMPDLELVTRYEAKVDYETLINLALSEIEIMRIEPDSAKEVDQYL